MIIPIPDKPIHVTWDNPTTGRPKTFCGAKLRRGCLFMWYEIPTIATFHQDAPLVPIKQRGHKNRNHTEFILKTRLLDRACKRCRKSDDYALAMLAAVP